MYITRTSASVDGPTRPARSGASPALRPHDQLKILSSFLHSLFPLSLPLLRQPSEGGGGFHVQGRQVDYTSDVATFPQFWHVGATPRQRPFMCNSTRSRKMFPVGKEGTASRTDNFAAIYEQIVQTMWGPLTSQSPIGLNGLLQW
jgi:hypothetical protein